MKHLQKSHPKGIILALLCITYFFQLIHCKKKKKVSFLLYEAQYGYPGTYQLPARSQKWRKGSSVSFRGEFFILFCFASTASILAAHLPRAQFFHPWCYLFCKVYCPTRTRTMAFKKLRYRKVVTCPSSPAGKCWRRDPSSDLPSPCSSPLCHQWLSVRVPAAALMWENSYFNGSAWQVLQGRVGFKWCC